MSSVTYVLVEPLLHGKNQKKVTTLSWENGATNERADNLEFIEASARARGPVNL